VTQQRPTPQKIVPSPASYQYYVQPPGRSYAGAPGNGPTQFSPVTTANFNYQALGTIFFTLDWTDTTQRTMALTPVQWVC